MALKKSTRKAGPTTATRLRPRRIQKAVLKSTPELQLPPTPKSKSEKETPSISRYGIFGKKLGKNTKEAQLYEQNQAQSPLLRLPPEIRLQIYTEVIGRHIICIEWAKGRRYMVPSPNDDSEQHKRKAKKTPQKQTHFPAHYYSWLHDAPPTDKESFDRWLSAPSVWFTQRAPYSYTPRPLHEPKKYNIAFLNTICRQLYHETALLPYKLNYFSFESPNTMQRFLCNEKILPLLHRRAIKKLVLSFMPSAAVEKALGALEMLMVSGGWHSSSTTLVCTWDEEGQVIERILPAYWQRRLEWVYGVDE